MKRYAEIEFDQLDEDEWRPLCEKMDALVMKHFGILVESYDANWDNPCWLLCEAMDTYETTKNRSYPSLSKTRGYLEKVKKFLMNYTVAGYHISTLIMKIKIVHVSSQIIKMLFFVRAERGRKKIKKSCLTQLDSFLKIR